MKALQKTIKFTTAAASSLLFAYAAVFVMASPASRRPAQSTAPAPDKKEILQKARGSYYVLQYLGVKSFQCTIQPNWKQFLEFLSQKPVAADDSTLPLLNPVQYSVVIDDQGAATITPFVPAGSSIDSRIDERVASAKQVIGGFFKAWSPMVVSTAFPTSDDDKYSLSEKPDGYHFTQEIGDANVELVLNKDLVLIAMNVASSSSSVVMLPKYLKTDKGLLMTSLDSNIDHGAEIVKFQVEYQTVEGFQLPGKVSYQVSLSGPAVPFEMTFSKYQLTKR